MPDRASPTETRIVNVGGEPLSYAIVRSADAAEPRIDVDMRGVRLILPVGEDVDADRLIKENGAWVLRRKAKYDRYRADAPARRFEEGATFPFLDVPHPLVLGSSTEQRAGRLQLDRERVRRTSIREELERLYRMEARSHFTARADSLSALMDLAYSQIEIRNQRTRWGSCSANGTLSLNWRLMMAPAEIVDYVIVHELAHLRVPRHGQRFWRLVAEHMPDYTEKVEWLSENSTQLIFSEEDL